MQAEQLPYVLDGNQEMYGEQHLEKRAALKSHPQVQSAIRKLVGIAPFGSKGLSKLDYKRFMREVAITLRPELIAEKEQLQFLLEEDWTKDSKGGLYLTQDSLFQSLFELIDVWTESAEAQEYSQLAKDIHGRVSLLF